MVSSPMLTSIATVSLSGSLAEKLSAIAEAGYGGVEIFEKDLVAADERPREIGRMIRDLGLVCTCYQPFRDFEGLQGEARVQAFDRARRKFDLMPELGAELMLVCSSVSPGASGDVQRIVDDFRELGDEAASRGLRVGYEALAWGRHVNDHRQAWDIVRQADHASVGIILDSFHSLARKAPIESLAQIDGDKIFLLQVADAPDIGMEPLFWSRHFRCFPGQGDLPVVDYVNAVAATGYRGPLSLEVFNDRFRSWPSLQIAEDGLRSLIWLEDRMAAVAGRPTIEPPAVSTGVRFIEFAAKDADAEALEKVFAALGFTLTGRHRGMSVRRWTQNDIEFVMNSEARGFANSHQLVHGASVCALGIGVGDPAAAVRRARALNMRDFSPPPEPGHTQMPSIRGAGGSLIYFTEAELSEVFWAEDFEPDPAAGGKGCGLTRVDHVAQSMRTEEFLSWVLFYLSLFDTRKTAPVDLADPLGLVQSQAIQSPDGALRITLNGAGGQTLASRFVDNYLGAGVQHIALASDDIFATIDGLTANGLELLEPTENYYDDLIARFGLDAALVARLREGRVFYDRDGEGEYFQVYTRAINKLVFFEIVERRSYGGYGAENAPVRLAAQARFKVEFGE